MMLPARQRATWRENTEHDEHVATYEGATPQEVDDAYFTIA